MAYDTRGQLTPEECLQILKLMPVASGTDYAMSVRAGRTGDVEGESPRLVSGRPRLDIEGYYTSLARVSGSGHAGQIEGSSLIVVRHCDKATASLGSVLLRSDRDLQVHISTYRATGDSSVSLQSPLEMIFGAAMLTQQVLFTGGHDGRPLEILAFAFRTFETRSAPQSVTGLIGPVNTCQFLGTGS